MLGAGLANANKYQQVNNFSTQRWLPASGSTREFMTLAAQLVMCQGRNEANVRGFARLPQFQSSISNK